MRALVTGAAGFVGTHLLRLLMAEDHEVHAMTMPGEELALSLRNTPTHPCDITDAAALEATLAAVRPAWIFHLAAVSSPGICRENPALAWEVNFVGTHNLYRIAANVSPEARVLSVGSAVEYGRPKPDDLPLTEDAPLRPNDVYAATKVAGDLVGAQFALSGRLAVIRARPFNHFGPGQSLGFVAPDFARQVADVERGLAAPVINVGNLDPARDFTDVRDVVRAYLLLVEKGTPGAAYNICSETTHTIRDLLDGLLALAKVRPEIKVAKGQVRRNETDVVVGCSEALRAATGWQPRIPWEQTLADLLEDWRKRVAFL